MSRYTELVSFSRVGYSRDMTLATADCFERAVELAKVDECNLYPQHLLAAVLEDPTVLRLLGDTDVTPGDVRAYLYTLNSEGIVNPGMSGGAISLMKDAVVWNHHFGGGLVPIDILIAGLETFGVRGRNGITAIAKSYRTPRNKMRVVAVGRRVK